MVWQDLNILTRKLFGDIFINAMQMNTDDISDSEVISTLALWLGYGLEFQQ